jgi:hypothetical protein
VQIGIPAAFEVQQPFDWLLSGGIERQLLVGSGPIPAVHQ